MLNWLQRLVRLSPQEQIKQIEEREPTLEERLDRLIARLGHYGKRTEADLSAIMDDLDKVLKIVEKIIMALENIGGAERARKLRTRLRNNRTRAQRALEAPRVQR